MEDYVLMLAKQGADTVQLLAPEVGWFTAAQPRGRMLAPGQEAGFLVVLGDAKRLLVPDGIAGIVRGERPGAVHAPVGFGDLLYELDPLESLGAAAAPQSGDARAAGPLVFRAPQTGRFWLRSSPAEAPLVQAGAVIGEGTAVGLIEVMKTFTHVLYRAGSGSAALPERARIARVLVRDGTDVSAGEPLLELEPAPQ